MTDVIADLESLTRGQAPSSNMQASSGSFADTGLTNFLKDISLEEAAPIRPKKKKPAGSSFWKENRRNLLIGGGVLGGLILLAGIIISLRTNVQVTKDIAVESNGTKSIGVTPVPLKRTVTLTKADAAPHDFTLNAERKAAEFVLSIGGEVALNFDYEHKIKAVSQLPKEAFVVSQIWLMENQNVTDRDLFRFKGCKGLWLLGLVDTRITDAGLADIANYESAPGMAELYLSNTSITDSGVAHLADCTGMHQLWINGTAVTDAGLNHLKRMNQMTRLAVTGTRVTDAGVRQLAAALPQCTIEWDGGKIEPKRPADSK
jgi:hypothetical protein